MFGSAPACRNKLVTSSLLLIEEISKIPAPQALEIFGFFDSVKRFMAVVLFPLIKSMIATLTGVFGSLYRSQTHLAKVLVLVKNINKILKYEIFMAIKIKYLSYFK